MLITLEGIDGSGKGTQARLLARHFADLGNEVKVFSFPQYGVNLFADAVGDYLNSEKKVDFPDMARFVSLLYACDRSTVSQQLRDLLACGCTIICDRYVESNLAHQVSRVPESESASLRNWILDVEYKQFRMPRPDRILLLDSPVPLAQERVAQKRRRSYTSRARDLHEADAEYLTRTRIAYLEMAQLDRERWVVVSNVAADGQPRSPIEVARECREAVGLLETP